MLTPDVDKEYQVPSFVNSTQENGLVFDNISYPCLILEPNTDELGGHIFKLLGSILDGPSLVDNYIDKDSNVYNIYINAGDKLSLVGYLHSSKLRILFDNSLFKCFSFSAYKDEGTKFEGEMLYSLCTSEFQ